MPVTGAALAAALTEFGAPLPAGHALSTLAERRDLVTEVEHFGSSVWPEFMLHDPVADRCWPYMSAEFPEYQLALLDAEGSVVAVARSAPLGWDGSVGNLPRGWDDQFSRSVLQSEQGIALDTLGAIMIVTDPARRGDRLGGLMVRAMCTVGRLHGLRALIACVRPTWLERYPLTPIAEYAAWRRGDGLPFDPWIRIHVRLGGRLSRAEPESMRITGSVGEWEAWTGMAFPASGRYVVPGACAPVEIDRDADVGTYHDPNVWVIHDLTSQRLSAFDPPTDPEAGAKTLTQVRPCARLRSTTHTRATMKHRLTIRLDDATLRRAARLAAQRSTTVSRLVAGLIERLVEQDVVFERARVAALADLETGFDLGSEGCLPSRESVHDR